MKSLLARANQAFQNRETKVAMIGYVNALLEMPELGKTIADNISRTRQQYLKSRNKVEPLKVIVCGWELAHNAAGRAYTLAEIYLEITSDVEIVGTIFPHWGREVWEPIRESKIPIHAFVIQPNHFIRQAIKLVGAHPADVVHLSKPRAPNIFFGVLYKLLWGAKIILDIDDEELMFVKTNTSITLNEYLNEYAELPDMEGLADRQWTRIAVGLAGEFDSITVSNAALKLRYGGTIIGHARDEKILKPCSVLREKIRSELGISKNKKVVLFCGTPRPHKGLFEVAKAIQVLKRDDIIFMIVGSFEKNNLELKCRLQELTGVQYKFLENQPLSELPRILSVADCCVLFQKTCDPISTYQIPAKLSDALAMGLNVLTTETKALSDIVAAGAVTVTTEEEIAKNLAFIIDNPSTVINANAKKYFSENLSIEINAARMLNVVKNAQDKKSYSNELELLEDSVLDLLMMK